MTNEIIATNGMKFHLYQNRLHDEMYVDGRWNNPILWWAVELDIVDRDYVACGTKTKQEAMRLIEQYEVHLRDPQESEP